MDPIGNYPITGQSILDTTLKDWLVSLRGVLHRDMIFFIAQVKSDISDIGDRLNHVENKIEEFVCCSS